MPLTPSFKPLRLITFWGPTTVWGIYSHCSWCHLFLSDVTFFSCLWAVRLLREELQLLQEQGSYVGEVVRAMDKKKVLVKVSYTP